MEGLRQPRYIVAGGYTADPTKYRLELECGHFVEVPIRRRLFDGWDWRLPCPECA